jgi:hypothetical protein
MLSPDGNRMYVMNLHQKQLVVLNISTATPTLVGQYTIPTPAGMICNKEADCGVRIY